MSLERRMCEREVSQGLKFSVRPHLTLMRLQQEALLLEIDADATSALLRLSQIIHTKAERRHGAAFTTRFGTGSVRSGL